MRTVEFKTTDGRTRYYLAGEDGLPVEPVMKFLKFRDAAGYARNTLKGECIHLMHYFEFLEERETLYEKVTIDDLARFVGWLKNPDIEKKIVAFREKPVHAAETINKHVDTVITFYDYLMRHDGMENRLSEKLVLFIKNPSPAYRSFLYGIADSKPAKSHMLKIPVSKRVVKTLKKEEAVVLLEACHNLRDYFLLSLLFETGMRIGEALALWLEDFDVSGNKIHICDRGELENLAEIKTVESPRVLDCTNELMDLFADYISMYHDADVETNHVLLKIRGDHKGNAMEYEDVDNLFRALRKRTGVYVTPHMFRHTSLSLLHAAGWNPELLKERAGHRNIYTTLNTYVHPTEEEITEAFRKASESLRMPGIGKEADQ